MSVLTHRCYNCDKTMTNDELIAGQLAMDAAVAEKIDWEGPWGPRGRIHCNPRPDQVMNPKRDTQILERLKVMGNPNEDYSHSIIVCKACVHDSFIQYKEMLKSREEMRVTRTQHLHLHILVTTFFWDDMGTPRYVIVVESPKEGWVYTGVTDEPCRDWELIWCDEAGVVDEHMDVVIEALKASGGGHEE